MVYRKCPLDVTLKNGFTLSRGLQVESGRGRITAWRTWTTQVAILKRGPHAANRYPQKRRFRSSALTISAQSGHFLSVPIAWDILGNVDRRHLLGVHRVGPTSYRAMVNFAARNVEPNAAARQSSLAL